MKAVTVHHPMKSPPDTVWEALIDLEHAAERISGITKIEMLIPGPPGMGMRWKESRRVMKTEQTETFEIVEWNPPHSYTARCESCGMEMLFKISVHADGEADDGGADAGAGG